MSADPRPHKPDVALAGLPPRKLLDYFPEFEKVAYKIIFGPHWLSLPETIADNIATLRPLPASDASRNILPGDTRHST